MADSEKAHYPDLEQAQQILVLFGNAHPNMGDYAQAIEPFLRWMHAHDIGSAKSGS